MGLVSKIASSPAKKPSPKQLRAKLIYDLLTLSYHLCANMSHSQVFQKKKKKIAGWEQSPLSYQSNIGICMHHILYAEYQYCSQCNLNIKQVGDKYMNTISFY